MNKCDWTLHPFLSLHATYPTAATLARDREGPISPVTDIRLGTDWA